MLSLSSLPCLSFCKLPWVLLLHLPGPTLSPLKLLCLSAATQSICKASFTPNRISWEERCPWLQGGHLTRSTAAFSHLVVQSSWSLVLLCSWGAKLLWIAGVWSMPGCMAELGCLWNLPLILPVILPLPDTRAVSIFPRALPYICPSWHSFPYFFSMFLISVSFLLFHCLQWYL